MNENELLEGFKSMRERHKKREEGRMQETADLIYAFYRQLIRKGMPQEAATHITGCYVAAAAERPRRPRSTFDMDSLYKDSRE
ncbi:MAG: hypothetical protein R6X32_06035 [Chloroflexota bacterium]